MKNPDGAESTSVMADWAGANPERATMDQIGDRLQRMGPGSSAIVGCDWSDGGGHWFNVVNDNGTIKAIDGQTGKVENYPPSKEGLGFDQSDISDSEAIFFDSDGQVSVETAGRTEDAPVEHSGRGSAPERPAQTDKFAADGERIPGPLTGDNLPTDARMGSDYAGEASGDPSARFGGSVHYFTPAESEAARVYVDSRGLLRNASDGSLLDTSGASTVHTGGEGKGIFVMDKSGNLYVSLEHSVGQLHHSSLLAGSDVAGAGEIQVDSGSLKVLTDKSGHYKPSSAMNDRVINELQSQGANLSPDFQHLGINERTGPQSLFRRIFG